MSEYGYIEGINASLSAEDIDHALQETRAGLETMIEHSPGESKVYPAMAQAIIERLENPGEQSQFASAVRGLARRTDLSGDDKAHLVRNALQFMLIKTPAAQYPTNGESVERWHEWLDDIQYNHYYLAELEDILGSKVTQATDPNRYAGPHLGIIAHASQYPAPFDLADIGCSAGFGNAQLGMNLGFPRTEFNASPGAKKLLHDALKKELSVGKNIGFDRTYETDWTWVASNSIYDYEVFDFDRIVRHERMRTAVEKARCIDIVTGDITLGETEQGVAGIQELTPDGKVDAVLFITSFYQIAPELRPSALRTAQSLGRVGLQIQDAIVEHSDGSIEIPEKIYTVPYSLHYMDLTVAEPKRRFIKLGEWESFRCRLFTPTEYLVERLYEESRADRSPISTVV